MEFDLTPDEARPIADAVAALYRGRRYRVCAEVPINSAPYRTTLLATKGHQQVLIEAQNVVEYHRVLRELVLWLRANQVYAEMYLATTRESLIPASVMAELNRDGIGIWVVNGEPETLSSALNTAMQVTINPELRLNWLKKNVENCVDTFNSSGPKHGLIAICELFEDTVIKLYTKAVAKGVLSTGHEVARGQGALSNCINVLSNTQKYHAGHRRLVDNVLETDLHSMRNARNLFDHPVDRRGETTRTTLAVEKMLLGIRLISSLVGIHREVGR